MTARWFAATELSIAPRVFVAAPGDGRWPNCCGLWRPVFSFVYFPLVGWFPIMSRESGLGYLPVGLRYCRRPFVWPMGRHSEPAARWRFTAAGPSSDRCFGVLGCLSNVSSAGWGLGLGTRPPTHTLCSLPMRTGPGNEVGPSSRWCCVELANSLPSRSPPPL